MVRRRAETEMCRKIPQRIWGAIILNMMPMVPVTNFGTDIKSLPMMPCMMSLKQEGMGMTATATAKTVMTLPVTTQWRATITRKTR